MRVFSRSENGEKENFWQGLRTAENAESAEKKIHHGVTRKVTDFLTADPPASPELAMACRRTQTNADFSRQDYRMYRMRFVREV